MGLQKGKKMQTEERDTLSAIVKGMQSAASDAAQQGLIKTSMSINKLADRLVAADIAEKIDCYLWGRYVLSIFHNNTEGVPSIWEHYSFASLHHAQQLMEILAFALGGKIQDRSEGTKHLVLEKGKTKIELFEYPF